MPDGIQYELIAIPLGILVGAFFAGLDAALAELGVVQLVALRDAGGPDATTARRAIVNLPTIQARLLTGRIVCLAVVVSSASRISTWSVDALPALGAVSGAALVYALTAETTITIARARAGRWALFALRAFRPFEIVLAPLAAPLVWVGRALRHQLPATAPNEEQARVATLAVEHMIDSGAQTGSIAEDQAALLKSVLEFEDTVAREVMVPRTKMIAIDASQSLDRILEVAIAEGHSRYPVYREKNDHIEGILHVKDLFKLVSRTRESADDLTLGAILRKPFFVAETQKVGDLLREMRHNRIHLAVVVDEFGGTAGILTLEDIVEEIVGDIRDEHDEEEPPAREVGVGQWLVDAGMSVHDLSEMLGAPLVPMEKEGLYESVGGLVIDLAGRVPAVGESVRLNDIEVVVRDADEKRVRRVEVRKLPPSNESNEAAA